MREAFDLAGDDGPAGVLRDGRPRLLRATSTTRCCAGWARDDAAFERLRAAGLRSAIVVPLMAGDRPIGAMTLGTDVSARVLGPAELELAQEVAVRAGVAVENARVHGVRAHIATTLQRSLLPPRLPAVPGMTIAARFRAAGEASEVGGDFYDLFSVDGAWMVVIGDVTGKGPEAASITALARYTMRTAAVYEESASGVLERLNAALVVDPDRRQICTVVAARIVSAPDGSVVVTVACGGHPAPFRLHGGRAEAVAAAGPLLGAFETGRWPETVGAPRPGREPRALHRRRHGHARARGPLRRRPPRRGAGRRRRTLEPDEIANRVDAALLAFEDGPQRDDVALLVLQATGAPASAAAPPAVGAPAADRAAVGNSPRRFRTETSGGCGNIVPWGLTRPARPECHPPPARWTSGHPST